MVDSTTTRRHCTVLVSRAAGLAVAVGALAQCARGGFGAVCNPSTCAGPSECVVQPDGRAVCLCHPGFVHASARECVAAGDVPPPVAITGLVPVSINAAGRELLSVSGVHLDRVIGLTVAGEPCTVQDQTEVALACVLPIVAPGKHAVELTLDDLTVVAAPQLLGAERFYFFSAAGDDLANDGLTAASAWASPEKLSCVTLEPGATVLFRGGDTFVVNAAIELGTGRDPASPCGAFSTWGTAERPIVFTSYGTGRATLRSPTDWALFHFYNAGGLRFENLRAVGHRNSWTALFSIEAGSHELSEPPGPIEFNNMELTTAVNGIEITLLTPSGEAKPFSRITVRDSYLSDLSKAVAINSYVDRTDHQTTGPVFSNVVIENNRIENLAYLTGTSDCAVGIDVSAAVGAVIAGNRIRGINDNRDNCGGVTLTHSHDSVVRGNDVRELRHADVGGNFNGACYFVGYGAKRNTVERNFCYDAEHTGLQINGYNDTTATEDNVLRYNVLINVGRTDPGAIQMWNSGAIRPTNNYVHNNLFYVTRDGALIEQIRQGSAVYANNVFARAQGSGALFFGDSVSALVMRGNLYYPVSGSFSFPGGTDFAGWVAATGQETESAVVVGMVGDPAFASPLSSPPSVTFGGDLHDLTHGLLLPASPVIGAGLDVTTRFGLPAPLLDFWGNAVDTTQASIGPLFVAP